MGGVCLDEARGGGVEEADLSVCGAGEDVLAASGGEGEGVDGGVVGGGEAGERLGWELGFVWHHILNVGWFGVEGQGGSGMKLLEA